MASDSHDRRALDRLPLALHLTSMAAESELDCLACGACCRQASDGRILVPAADIVRWRRAGRLELVAQLVEGHFSELAFAATREGACVHLGTATSRNACSIYEERGTTCREFERGGWQCLEFRREGGLTTMEGVPEADHAPRRGPPPSRG